ncbi:hypothetical protein ABMA27_005648 [Loxostege sticticalis]|uniref:Midgut protein n=1 Tax=Loxostege sticticalis TaxID=481309 RepID=A0ABR3HJY1_LOXSC
MLCNYILVFMLVNLVVCTEDCVTYDFGNDFQNFTSGACQGSWEHKKDHTIENGRSTSGITPSSKMSCTSSFIFPMHNGGVLEVNVYYSIFSLTDILQVVVYQKETIGPDRIVGMESLDANNKGHGRKTLKINVAGSLRFDGYLTIFGQAFDVSSIFVDSFRYMSPYLTDKESCEIYDDNSEASTTSTEYSTESSTETSTESSTETSTVTSTESSTETSTESSTESSTSSTVISTDPSTETPTGAPNLQYCVTNNFEENFHQLFGATGICSRTRNSFERRSYSRFGPDSPHSLSTVFITPTHRMSCIASSPFTMHANGVLQVYIYLQTLSTSDHISVTIYKKVSPTQEQIVGSFTTEPRRHRGWNIFSITLRGDEVYEGYVAFTGMVSIRSIALIDSFRYVPPSVDESSCVVYEQIPASTTEANDVLSTTDASDVSSSSVTSDVSPTTDANDVLSTSEAGEEENGCVVYPFGQDFNKLFSAGGVCRFSQNWVLRNYASLRIASPHPESVSCIVPGSTSSCTSSFVFPMSASGVVEVKVYMEPMVMSDQVEVRVYQINENGSNAIVGTGIASRRFGWTTIRIHLAGSGDYRGQVAIFGRTSIRTSVVVDSFRYIPPHLDENQCLVYSKDHN